MSGVTVLGLDRAAIEGVGVWRNDWASGRGRAERWLISSSPRVRRTCAGSCCLTAASRSTSARDSCRSPPSSAPSTGRSVESSSERRDRSASTTALAHALLQGRSSPPSRSSRRRASSRAEPTRESPSSRRFAISGPLASAAPRLDRRGRIRVAAHAERRPRARSPSRFSAASGLRASQPTDESPPAVLVTPRLAELAGGVGQAMPLQIGGGSVPVTVAGVVERFPGTDGDVVVGDRIALANRGQRGGARRGARERGVARRSARARRRRRRRARRGPRSASSTTTSRTDVEDEARRDPLAQGTLLALVGTAAVALLLAALGLALAVRADLRDESGEHFDLEAQGASPALPPAGGPRARRDGLGGRARRRDRRRDSHCSSSSRAS